MHSNNYTFMYAAGISIITAVLLSVLSQGLKPLQEANVALDTKKNILRSVRIEPEGAEAVEATYDKSVKALVVNGKGEIIEGADPDKVKIKDEVSLPAEERTMALYVFQGDDGVKKYIMPLRGVGLWGPIWGYIALDGDFNTVYGATFDHKAETPGLGAEIAEGFFQKQFQGKKVMANDNFVSVRVVKKGIKTEYGDGYQVDGISGGTITSNGTDKMIENCLRAYLPYFATINKSTPAKS